MCLSWNKICSRHDIAEILLMLTLNTNQSINNKMCSLHDRAEIQLMLALITDQSTNLYNVWQLLKTGVKVTITNKDITYSTVDKKLWKSIFDSNKTGTIKHLAKYLCSVRLHYIFSMEPSVDFRVAQWVSSLDLTTQTSISPIRWGFAPSFVDYKKGALDLQPQVI